MAMTGPVGRIAAFSFVFLGWLATGSELLKAQAWSTTDRSKGVRQQRLGQIRDKTAVECGNFDSRCTLEGQPSQPRFFGAGAELAARIDETGYSGFPEDEPAPDAQRGDALRCRSFKARGSG